MIETVVQQVYEHRQQLPVTECHGLFAGQIDVQMFPVCKPNSTIKPPSMSERLSVQHTIQLTRRKHVFDDTSP